MQMSRSWRFAPPLKIAPRTTGGAASTHMTGGTSTTHRGAEANASAGCFAVFCHALWPTLFPVVAMGALSVRSQRPQQTARHAWNFGDFGKDFGNFGKKDEGDSGGVILKEKRNDFDENAKTVDDLLRQAARLRAEASILETEEEACRLEKRRSLFHQFDTDNSGSICTEKLQKGMTELLGIHTDRDMAVKMLDYADTNKDGVIGFDEFDQDSLVASFEKIKKLNREKENDECKTEMFQKRIDREQAEIDRFLSRYEDGNDDDSLLVRAVSCLPYLLPFMDTLRYGATIGVAIAMLNPSLVDSFTFFWQFQQAWNMMPFTHLVLFIVMQLTADRTDLPVLLRYNMRQAVILDVCLGFITTLWLIVTFVLFGQVMPLIAEPSRTAIFLCMNGGVLYSVWKTMNGQIPNELPTISVYAERSMQPTKASMRKKAADLKEKRLKAWRGKGKL